MRAQFQRLGARRPIVIEPKGLKYLVEFAARAYASKPCAQPFPFHDHRTIAQVDAQQGGGA